MARITKTGEGYYRATPTGKDGIPGRNDCSQLKRELSLIIKSHREISIDVQGIKSINSHRLFRVPKGFACNRFYSPV